MQANFLSSLGEKQIFIFCIILIFILLAIDSITPFGIADWFLYVIVIIIASLKLDSKKVILVTLLTIGAITAGFFISPKELIPNFTFINRLLVIIIFLLLAYFIRKYKKSQGDYYKKSDELLNIIHRMHDSFFSLDKEWNIIYMNETAKKYGTIDNYKGVNIWKKFPLLKGTNFEKECYSAMLSREEKVFEFESVYLMGIKFKVSIYPTEEGLTIYSHQIT